jgi:flagellar basal body-associated protein FliL
MSEDRRKRSPLLWIIVAIGIAMLIVAAAVVAAFLILRTGPVPFAMAKHIEGPTLAPVTGTVMLDGKPLKHALVKFVPVVDSTNDPRPGLMSVGSTGADGNFTMAYATDGDGKSVMGAEIGLHQVQIQLNDLRGEQVIPPKYGTSKSELKVDVKLGMAPVHIALKSEPVEAPE